MKRPSITSFVAALLLGTIALVALAEEPLPVPPPWWPATKQNILPVVKEWYSDLPWHQKLGTYAGNQIDEPIIMPYGALPQADIDFCNSHGLTNPADCMIEVGVTNILGMQRIDTPYSTTAPAIMDAPECKGSLPCIQVMLRVSNFYAKSGNGQVSLEKRVYGDGVCNPDPIDPSGACTYTKGYTLSDGTTYAPQMPWYMSHYCDAMFPLGGDFNDAVCYGDYLSTFNSGFNSWDLQTNYWPKSVPWSVWPAQPLPTTPPQLIGGNVCLEGETVCNIVLAGFDLKAVPSAFTADLQYSYNNGLLLEWFNNALQNFKKDQGDDYLRHFPWSGNTVTWDDFYLQSAQNPFLGTFPATEVVKVNCNSGRTGPVPPGCGSTSSIWRATRTLYPRQCSLTEHLVSGDAATLRSCGLDYELHHNGWVTQWPPDKDWQVAMRAANMNSNQYGRTSFLFAGVPGMQLPVSFYKDPNNKNGYSIYEQVYNASIFSMYLPIANEADTQRQMPDRFYKDDFYHTLLMSNHNESDPDTFADGLRGKTLWHNEYRTHYMYARSVQGDKHFPPETFNAAFSVPANPPKPLLPFHNNTCDGCHLRNGSGVPIKFDGTLDVQLQEYMTAGTYQPNVKNDYTFTGVIRPMKLVLFDLKRSNVRPSASKYSTPLAFTPLTLLRPPRTAQSSDLYYNNAIMNYYGDAFHVTAPGYKYSWSYTQASQESQVVSYLTQRKNPETGKIYKPQQVSVSQFQTPFENNANCQLVLPGPAGKPWPARCEDVNGGAIANAVQTQAVGYMLLNGRRLGNSSAIEAMTNDAIKGFRETQKALLGEAMAGELIYTAGSRDGVLEPCTDTNKHSDCFIGRFGWLGDRASLEDQVANAAFVEMNMTSKDGYTKFYGANGKTTSPIRYLAPNCGPANKACVESKDGNSDLSERDIERMADYARWVGNPTRSEFQVTLSEVVAGEGVFRKLQCNSCHVIDKISLDPLETNSTVNTMLPAVYRDRLKNRAGNNFLSYLGTDLLMHDMGYLSQVGTAPPSDFRDKDGVVNSAYQNFVQKIRTPPLKAMRFNRYVTESYKNTKNPYVAPPTKPNDPACDFLLHDGRACDAIEAAFLHDGPAINKLGIIDKLTKLPANEVLQLRAFLYSL